MTDSQKEMLVEWIEALESGKYVQIRRELHRGGKCCCAAGVACDLLRDRLGLTVLYDIRNNYVSYDENKYVLPDKLKEALPIDWEHLINMNDILESSFNDIATWLRETYLD